MKITILNSEGIETTHKEVTKVVLTDNLFKMDFMQGCGEEIPNFSEVIKELEITEDLQ